MMRWQIFSTEQESTCTRYEYPRCSRGEGEMCPTTDGALVLVLAYRYPFYLPNGMGAKAIEWVQWTTQRGTDATSSRCVGSFVRASLLFIDILVDCQIIAFTRIWTGILIQTYKSGLFVDFVVARPFSSNEGPEVLERIPQGDEGLYSWRMTNFKVQWLRMLTAESHLVPFFLRKFQYPLWRRTPGVALGRRKIGHTIINPKKDKTRRRSTSRPGVRSTWYSVPGICTGTCISVFVTPLVQAPATCDDSQSDTNTRKYSYLKLDSSLVLCTTTFSFYYS